MRKIFLLLASHVAIALIGFGGGIYALPILMAPEAPAVEDVRSVAEPAGYSAEFRRDLEDSDALHWGDGKVLVGRKNISLEGTISPGPDYKLYLSPEFVETEADFIRLKDTMVRVGDVKTFNNFIVSVPQSVDPAAFTTVIIWCEAFSQFITAARYQ